MMFRVTKTSIFAVLVVVATGCALASGFVLPTQRLTAKFPTAGGIATSDTATPPSTEVASPWRKRNFPWCGLKPIQKELLMTWKMLKGNSYAHLSLGMLVISANIMATRMPAVAACHIIPRGFVWFTAYGYVFDLRNQLLDGAKGDAANAANGMTSKQDRPLLTGELSVEAAQQRCWIAVAGFVLASIYMGRLPLALCAAAWTTISVFYGPLSSHYFTKNHCTMSIGSICMLVGARILTGRSWWHLPSVAIGLWAGCNASIQDFRDEVGDRLDGRRTLPICFGARTAKKAWMMQNILTTAVLGCWLFWNRSSLLFFSWTVDGAALVATVVQMVHTGSIAGTVPQWDAAYRNYVTLLALLFMCSCFW